MPTTAAEVEAACHIGSLCPDEFATGTYTLMSGAGTEVEAYTLASGSDAFDVDSVLKVVATERCYANKVSTVRVGAGSSFAFRNAPHFVSFLTPTATDAEHETEAVLDHLFHHPNTAPFVSSAQAAQTASSRTANSVPPRAW